MLFHIYNIEQKSESEVYLFGKPQTDGYVPMETIRVTNVISPVYFLPSNGQKDRLISDLYRFTGGIKEIEEVDRTNIFHRAVPRRLKLLRVHFHKRVSFEDFESDFCEMILTEFSNPVENIILSLGLRGPCVVEISVENKNAVPHQEITADISQISFVRTASFPELKICSMIFVMNKNEISRYVYCDETGIYKGEVGVKAVSAKQDCFDVVFKDPRDLLSHLNNILKSKSPDIVLTHNFHLKNRLNIRDKIYCDIFSFASGTIKGRDYSIEEIAQFYKIPLGYGMVWQAQALIQIFKNMHALNLAKEMAEISGYILNRSLSNSRSERIEYNILHELYARKFLFPLNQTKTAEAYTGGLVLDPQVGLYENLILLLDFNSLYPSVIQEFDVCFSTIGSPEAVSIEEDLVSGTTQTTNHEDLILPKILANFVTRRKEVKEQMKRCASEDERTVLDVRQKALKLTANSIYGCLGSNISRFCNYKMASFITAKGRELLVEAKSIAEGLGMNVIYGDTDSIMISTKYPGRLEYYDKAINSANELVDKINARYSKIEIEAEKVFKKLLLYTKKKYAALVLSKDNLHIESKGLDLIRRDFCKASSEVLNDLLNAILLGEEDREEDLVGQRFENVSLADKKAGSNPLDSKNSLSSKIYSICHNFAQSLKQRPIEDFVINSVLSKDLNQYSTPTTLPHVALANRLTAENGLVFRHDDVVSYVIGEGDAPVCSRAFHPGEKFSLDYSYYIKHQILPSIHRLLSLISWINHEKISLIFGAKEPIPVIETKAITFVNSCCGHTQPPSTTCNKCSSVIDKKFYIFKVHEKLKEMCSKMYTYKHECFSCGAIYLNHVVNCVSCNMPLKFSSFNEEFESHLSALESSFKMLNILEVNEMLKLYSGASAYRRFDLTKYFKEEVLRAKQKGY